MPTYSPPRAVSQSLSFFYDKSFQINPSKANYDALFQQGRILAYGLGAPERAFPILLRCVELAPDEAGGLLHACQMLMAGPDGPAKARALYESAVSRTGGKSLYPLLLLGFHIWKVEGKPEEGLPWLLKAYETNKEDAFAVVDLALLLFHLALPEPTSPALAMARIARLQIALQLTAQASNILRGPSAPALAQFCQKYSIGAPNLAELGALAAQGAAILSGRQATMRPS